MSDENHWQYGQHEQRHDINKEYEVGDQTAALFLRRNGRYTTAETARYGRNCRI